MSSEEVTNNWDNRYEFEKTGGVMDFVHHAPTVLQHPMIADIAETIGRGVTKGLHTMGDAASYLSKAVTFHADPTKDPKILNQVHDLRELAGAYPSGSWGETSRLQKAHDLLANHQVRNWGRDAVGVALHTLNALLLKKQLPKALERAGLKTPASPLSDYSNIREQ